MADSSTTHHDGFIHQILTAKANREFQISIMEVPSRLVFLLVSLLSLVFSLSDSATVVVDGVSEWKNPTVHIGDSIIFKHKYDYKLYIFQNRGAFNLCNFTQASLLTKPNSNSFTWHPSRTGIFYFSFNNGTLKSCQSAQKLAITVSLSPPQNSATSPELSPAASPAPSSGGIVSSSPAYPWPFQPRESMSPSPAPTAILPAASPDKGDGIPFINSNPAVPLPTGEVDSATIRPLPTSSVHGAQVVGLLALQMNG
ncbi:early nodulin-like protein 1 [Camellia sinensis]|nr:early nodulin-like protein 1 [Camellia sinensis]